jgi:hypothetical protein
MLIVLAFLFQNSFIVREILDHLELCPAMESVTIHLYLCLLDLFLFTAFFWVLGSALLLSHLRLESFLLAVSSEAVYGLVNSLQHIATHSILYCHLHSNANSMLCFKSRTIVQIMCEIASLCIALLTYAVLVPDIRAGIFGTLWLKLERCVTRLKDLRRWIELCSLVNERAPPPPPEAIGSPCMICQRAMTAADAKMLPCGDCLHTECLRESVYQYPDCPNCKADLRELTAAPPITGFSALICRYFALTATTHAHHPGPAAD